jgi:DNA-binding GntR family transcriptional regulator
MGGTCRMAGQHSTRAVTSGSLVDRAYAEIKRRVFANEYPAGFQALEQEVARQLGMSRTPVHEALIRLENEGLIELVPRRGMRVLPLSPLDMSEICQVLTCLEAMAAELLARRHPPPSELRPLAEAIDRMERALEVDDLDEWADADDAFHRCLVGLSGNTRLGAMALTLWDLEHRARLVSLRLRPKPWLSNQEHRAVLEAVERGDWEAARASQQHHRMRAATALKDLLAQYRFSHL